MENVSFDGDFHTKRIRIEHSYIKIVPISIRLVPNGAKYDRAVQIHMAISQ
jgi:hypothetical protein